MAAPSVYAAINAITAELAGSGIPKTRFNEVDDYKYRSIDDVQNRLAPLLAKHRLCVLPRVLKRHVIERQDADGQLLIGVTLRVAFALVSADDGSSHLVEAYGEALDTSDKGTAKAMSAAYKSAMIQAFCIPVGDLEDADASSHTLAAKTHMPEPVQGWEQWARDIQDLVAVCESEQAIDTVQDRNRELLKAISRERSELYNELGQCLSERRLLLRGRTTPHRKPKKVKARISATGTEAAHG
jgi:hypothetical protein